MRRMGPNLGRGKAEQVSDGAVKDTRHRHSTIVSTTGYLVPEFGDYIRS
jgi:hypothetical protein